ncbi:divergent polysaccharide deacetylase family protein [Acidihalobacter prosperus]|uniref:Divergent polysaccharide deacetylase n=1 Tax=Acidihalobacter prosperus TaxID=160660 RepID=A0A1A6C4A8_9GAMM|nr:divergent polysaccharide deacetylase family protein [Acidihalobacter prosperus]OBS09402.1 hypothetical protein Thpro_021730 [Acidihalobacter prosperus]
MRIGLRLLALLLTAAALLGEARAAEIAIIIDDVGYDRPLGLQAAELPGPVTLAFLPDTPYAASLARRAYRAGKQIMLHLPMQSLEPHPLGPGGLTLHMTRSEIRATLLADLASLPHVAGINNHMGSLLTQNAGDMAWLMQDIRQIGGLFFIDSLTTPQSAALEEARRAGIPSAARDIFLDDVREPAYIDRQLDKAIAIARARGSAIAIGHPYAATLEVLRRRLPQLAAEGVHLVTAGQLIRGRQAHLMRAGTGLAADAHAAGIKARP